MIENTETLTFTPEGKLDIQPVTENETQKEAVKTPVVEESTPAADESADQQSETEATSEGEEEQHDEPKKRDGGVQKRIRELVEERNQERLERQKLTQQLADALSGRNQQKPEQELPKQQVDPGEAPNIEKFDSYEKYLDARADWSAAQRIRAAQDAYGKQQEEARRQEFITNQHRQLVEQQAKLKQITTDAEAKYPDFYDKVFPGDDKAVPISEVVAQALLESEKSADLMYYLSTNRAEAERIAKLSPARQLVEIGKLESLKELPTAQKSKAPAPIQPVSGRKATANDMPRDEDDMDTWVRKEEARTRKSKS